jgi:hypothetical protein
VVSALVGGDRQAQSRLQQSNKFLATVALTAHYVCAVAYIGGVMESRENQRQKYLSKALEAEKLAAAFEESFYRTSWLGIAEGYRKLAEELEAPEGVKDIHP